MNNNLKINHSIIITGASGYVGSSLIKILIQKKFRQKIFALDRVDLPKEFVANPEIIFYKTTLDNYRELNYVISNIRKRLNSNSKPILFHLAALFVKDFSEREKYTESDYKRNNVLATKNLIEVIESNNFIEKIIYLSAAYIYKKSSKLYNKNVQDPLDAYARTKLEGEILLSKSSIPSVILRSVRIIGLPFQSNIEQKIKVDNPTFSNLFITYYNRKKIPHDIVSSFIFSGINNPDNCNVIKVMNSNITRTYIHISDLINALLSATNVKATKGIIYNVTSFDSISLEGIAQIIREELEKIGFLIKLNLHKSSVFDSVLAEFSYAFGWKPKISTSVEVIKKTAEQYINFIYTQYEKRA